MYFDESNGQWTDGERPTYPWSGRTDIKYGDVLGYDSESGMPTYADENYGFTRPQSTEWAPSQWSVQNNLVELERRIANGTATQQDIQFMGQLSSVGPEAGAQAMWNDFVTRRQDQQAGPSWLGLDELGQVDMDNPLVPLGAMLGGMVAAPAIAGAGATAAAGLGAGSTLAAGAGGALAGGTLGAGSAALMGQDLQSIGQAGLMGAAGGGIMGAGSNALFGTMPGMPTFSEAPMLPNGMESFGTGGGALLGMANPPQIDFSNMDFSSLNFDDGSMLSGQTAQAYPVSGPQNIQQSSLPPQPTFEELMGQPFPAPSGSTQVASSDLSQGLQGTVSGNQPQMQVDPQQTQQQPIQLSQSSFPELPQGFNPASDPNTNFNVGPADPNVSSIDPITGTAYSTGNSGGGTTGNSGGNILNTIGGGLTTAGGVISGVTGVNNLVNGGGQQPTQQNTTQPTTPQTNWPGIIGSGIEYAGAQQYRKDLLGLMERGIQRADPFYDQRGQYQQQLQNMNRDPSWMQNDPIFGAIRDQALNTTEARMGNRGYLGSGNMAHELTRTSTEAAAPYAMNRMNQVAQWAGANANPAAAGQTMSTFGPMAAQAGLQSSGALGSMFRNGMGQTGDLGTMVQGVGNAVNTAGNAWNSIQNWWGE